jgi:uncharacterized protein (TIGR02453 family)
VTGFAGYRSEAFEFLEGLAADNTKAFFDAHRSTYDNAIAAPTRRLVDEMTPLLRSAVHPEVRGEAKVGRSLFRINRDVRFAKDKTPYNTYVDMMWWIGGDDDPRACPAVIIRLTSATVLLGAGHIGLRGYALDRFRQRLVEPSAGAELRTTVDERIAAGSRISEPVRARAPKGFPIEHANADLARRDGFHLHHTTAHPTVIGSPRFAVWCSDELAPYAPLLAWFAAR